MLILRYSLLVLFTALGGVATGFLWLVPNGLMAGAMCFCFSLGTIWLAEKQRRRPGSVGLPDVLAAGVVSGALAILPVMLLETIRRPPTFRESDIFRAPELEYWYLIAFPLLLGIALHWSYHTRCRGKRPLWKVALTACASASIIRAILQGFQSGVPGDLAFDDLFRLLLMGPILAIFGPVPFAALWIFVTAKLDPAFGTTPTPVSLFRASDLAVH